jgi:hypothetical protein
VTGVVGVVGVELPELREPMELVRLLMACVMLGMVRKPILLSHELKKLIMLTNDVDQGC